MPVMHGVLARHMHVAQALPSSNATDMALQTLHNKRRVLASLPCC